jgi:hypothetical protein
LFLLSLLFFGHKYAWGVVQRVPERDGGVARVLPSDHSQFHMSKSKSKQEEALQLLDDLDSLSPAASAANAQGQNPEEVLAFLDEIAQKSTAEPARLTAPQADRPSSRAGTPTIRKSSERVRVGGGAALLKSSSTPPLVNASPTDKNGSASTTSEQTAQSQAGGGWGWGTVWSSASAALQQAKTVVDEQVKNLPANEQARKVIEYARIAQLDRLGPFLKLHSCTKRRIQLILYPRQGKISNESDCRP